MWGMESNGLFTLVFILATQWSRRPLLVRWPIAEHNCLVPLRPCGVVKCALSLPGGETGRLHRRTLNTHLHEVKAEPLKWSIIADATMAIGYESIRSA